MRTIKKIKRLDETTLRPKSVGDNWHMSWANDDRQYVSLCDGSGFPDTPPHKGNGWNSRAYAILGDPPDMKFEYLPGYPDLPSFWGTRNNSRYYNFGILALDGTIYQFLSAPNRPFREPDPRFVGAKLIYSHDNGRTWHNQDGSMPVVWEEWETRNRQNMFFFNEPGDAFSLITILQMGRNYADNKDGYVYLYAPNGNTEGTMNQLALARVPKGRILHRQDYEYFAGGRADGSAQWSKRIEDRGVVHTFPSGWVNRLVHPYSWHPSVVYYAPTNQYLMANWGIATNEKGEWFTKPSYLGFWTASTPWGPWKQVHEETVWTPGGDLNARAYQPQIAPKWIARDGKSFWLVWTDYQMIGENRPYYAFNLQKVEVTIE